MVPDSRSVFLVWLVYCTLSRSHASSNAHGYFYVTLDPVEGASVHEVQGSNPEDSSAWTIQDDYVAKALFNNTINENGWSFLELQSSGSYSDENQAYAAGFLEGYVTNDLIYKHWYNTLHGFCDGREKVCRAIQKYLDKNNQWIKANIDAREKTDPYWYQVKLFYLQLKGIKDGYNSGMQDPSKHMKFNDVLWFNIQGDLGDLTNAFATGPEARGSRWQSAEGSGSCSALVKVLPGSSDLYVAHDTWSSFQNMLRVQKLYLLPLRRLPGQPPVPGAAVSFSSYPGIINSGDDFYVLSSGLVTLETTIGVNDPGLWKFVLPSQVLETVRSVVANRLATDGASWTRLFRAYNSGTYNNQWMVVDYKRWRAGTPPASLPAGLLWVLEQLPGLVVAGDRTDVLRHQTYWPSYNSPSFPEVFNASGTQHLVDKFGDWFTYSRTPRALMFKRGQGQVRDLRSMLALMEYNDFRHDPLARCELCRPPYSGENAIAARNDLSPANGSYPWHALGHRSHASIDTKITTAALAASLRMLARSGPPFNSNIEPFRWSTADFGPTTPHLGHPDLWMFPPVTHRWAWRH